LHVYVTHITYTKMFHYSLRGLLKEKRNRPFKTLKSRSSPSSEGKALLINSSKARNLLSTIHHAWKRPCCHAQTSVGVPDRQTQKCALSVRQLGIVTAGIQRRPHVPIKSTHPLIQDTGRSKYMDLTACPQTLANQAHSGWPNFGP
jgi:hypothetical protein